MTSYGKFKDFEIRDVVYLGEPPSNRPIEFDLVKWEEHEPYEVLDLKTGAKKISRRSCFSIARLWWNTKESCFEFESCELRYLEYREDGLEEWIQQWCKLKEIEITYTQQND